MPSSLTKDPQNYGISGKIISLKDYLQISQDSLMQIPFYQRPYEWSENEISNFFSDISSFSRTCSSKDASYFIGAIITQFETKNSILTCNVVDGQQRTISIFLLLSALAVELKKYSDKNAKDCLDRVNKVLIRSAQHPAASLSSKPHSNLLYTCIEYTQDEDSNIEFQDSNDNDILQGILCTGKVDPTANDNFSTNFTKLQQLLNTPNKDQAFDKDALIKLTDCLFNNVFLLHTQVEAKPLAFKIFETLNARGLSLSEIDQLKAIIYGRLPENDSGEDYTKSAFIERWKKLEYDVSHLFPDTSNIKSLFNYHQRIIAAKEGITRHEEMGTLINFWKDRNYQQITEDVFLDDLNRILDFIYLMGNDLTDNQDYQETALSKLKDRPSNEPWIKSSEIRKALHLLCVNGQDVWITAALCFWWFKRGEDNFEEEFLIFLHKAIASQFSYIFLQKRQPNYNEFLKLNNSIAEKDINSEIFPESQMDLLQQEPDENDAVFKLLYYPTTHQCASLLSLVNYSLDASTVPLFQSMEVEHIIPRRWKAVYKDEESNPLDEHIESLGNKTLLTKRCNCKASNEFFSIKLPIYTNDKEQPYAISFDAASFFLSKGAKNKGPTNAKQWIEAIEERGLDLIQKANNIMLKWEDEFEKYFD